MRASWTLKGTLRRRRRLVSLPAPLWVLGGVLALGGAPATGQESQVVAAGAERAFGDALDPTTIVDPAEDGWESEVWSEKVDARQAQIARFLEGREPSAGELEALVGSSYRGDPLAPRELRQRFQDGVITVRVAAVEELDRRESSAATAGVDGFRSAIEALARRLDGFGDRHAKLKLFRIEPSPGAAAELETTSYLQISGVAKERARQIDAVWRCRWTLATPDGEPQLLEVRVADYEETDSRLPGGHLFEDVTASAVGHNASYREHLLRQPEHWLSRLTKAQGFNKIGWQGISVADVDGDGLEDLFLPDQGGLPNRLYRQRPDGRFEDVSRESRLDFLDKTLAGLFVDLDNDGDPDLVLASRPALLILENDGRGVFEQIRFVAGAIPDNHSLSAADYDLDGDLDLYVCAYRRSPDERGVTSPIPYHDANNGGRNALLRNDGDFRFQDVTEEVGLDHNNRRFSLAAAWEDYDNDGDADLYVANDYGRNNLYQNRGPGTQPRFVDVAGELGVEDISSGMSVSWADYDRDGRMDLYVGNMFSAAGNRITYQRKFDRERQRAGPLAQIQRMARGNSLFENREGGFLDRSEEAAVTMGRWAWSSLFADLNNDGWQDLVVANGNLTQSVPDDL